MLPALLTALLVSSVAHADRLLERLCFTSADAAAQAIPILNTVLVKGQDEIQSEGLCLNVFVEAKRGEVFERWVALRLPHAQTQFSTRNAPREHCEMELEKKVYREEIITQIGAGGKVVNVLAGKDVLQSEETSQLRMTSGSPATLLVTPNEVEIICTKKASGRSQIKITLKTVPQTIPNLTDPSKPVTVPPPNATGLSTEVETGPGEEVNLGEIVKNLAKDEQQVELPPGFTKQRTIGEEKTSWVLKIK